VIRIPTIYRDIANYLNSHGAYSKRQRIRTRIIADAVGKSAAMTLRALKMLEGSVVQRFPKATNPHPFVSRQVGNEPVAGDYQADVDYIYALAASNSIVSKIVAGQNLRQLNMRNPRDRERYNAVAKALRKAGFNSRLATYKFVAGSFYWSLTPTWKTNLKRLVRKLTRGQTTLD
jgi:hypothetical protein